MEAHPEETVLGKAYDARLVRRLAPTLRRQAPLLLLSLLVLAALSAAQLVQPYLVKTALDNHILAPDPAGLWRVVLLYVAAFAAELVLRFLQLVILETAGQNALLELRNQVFSHLQRLPASFFDANPVGRLMTRVTTDVESLAEIFSSGVVSILSDSLKLCAIVGILLWMDPRLAGMTLLVVPVLVALSVFFRKRIRDTYRRLRERLSRLNGFLQENLAGMQVVQLFSRQEDSFAEFQEINLSHREAELTSVVYESIFSAAVEWVGVLAVALILWFGGGPVVRGALTFGTLVAFLEYTQKFFVPIRDLSANYAVMQSAMASLERIFGLLDTPLSVQGPPAPRSLEAARGEIVFDNVSFAYRGDERVLRDVSFQVRAGEKVAIVGATGAGKTTLVKLLTRLYDVTGGRILLDGADLRDLDPRELRRQVGIVLQDHFLVSGTVEDNIRFGRPSLSREAVEAAAAGARLGPILARLPRGLEEEVRERGNNLSHGERQLVSMARALAYDPRVLVLDEATSSVDTETEERIRRVLDDLMVGRTTLAIAHRLSTVMRADRILVFHHGRLAESGTHSGLMALGGIYRRLVLLQFPEAAGARPPGPGAPG